MSKGLSRAGLLALCVWLALLVFWIAHSTLALPYYSDDFEHAGLVAQIRAGLEPGRDLITQPFHGQLLVLLRLLFWFGTMAGGMGITWVRMGICAAHAAAAIGCSILCLRWTGSRFAALLAGTLYAGALGFINEQIWWPSSGIFCLGAAFLIFALIALDARKPWAAVLMLAIAALSLSGILVAALALPLYCLLFDRRRVGFVFLGIILAALLLSSLAVGSQMQLSLRGAGLGAWLIFTAPLRFFAGFTTLPAPGFRTIWKLAPIAWLPLVASVKYSSAVQRRLLLVVWTPAILLALLVGMARADYPFRFGPGSLYTSDRYYYFFLLPLVVQCVLFVTNFRLPRWRSVAILAITALALLGSRAHYLANVPRATFEAAARALDRGRALVATIRFAAANHPLTLTNAPIPMDGARNNALSLAFLIYLEYPRGIHGVRLTDAPINPRDAAIENSIFNRWSSTPPACVIDGHLQPVRATSRIDFQNASYDENLNSGFSWWEGPLRWMGTRGSLHLTAAPGDLAISAYAPVDQLHRPIQVMVLINGHPTGGFTIAAPGIHEYRLQPPPLEPGGTAQITLAPDFVWHARDIFPESLDERDLSIAVAAIGFGSPGKPSSCAVPLVPSK